MMRPRRGLRNPRLWRESGEAYLYLLPAFFIMSMFVFYPFINALVLSFQEVDLVARVDGELVPFYRQFVGLSNFQRLFGDRHFIQALRITSIYVGVSVPLTIGLALVLATALSQALRLRPFFRLAFFIPYITPVVALAMVWTWIYHDRVGLLNYFLQLLGFSRVRWLNDPAFAVPAIVLFSVMRYVGYQALILLAGMQNIDRTYYEAAIVDGATPLQAWRRITVPLLTPQLFFVFLISLMSAYRIFDEVFILFAGTPGPLGSARTIVIYLYNQAFVDFRFGQAAAASVVLFGIIFVLALFQITVTQRRVHYDQ
ncbi:MAG: sugar ABC transporter permease [Candidatus Bipolaricaulota bacterium]